MSITIQDKTNLLKVWEEEAKRFEDLYQSLSPEWLDEKILTSTCGHTFGQHIACMLVWFEPLRDFFNSRLKGEPQPFRDYSIGMLKWTNLELDKVSHLSYSQLWEKLREIDAELRQIIKEVPDEKIFTKEENAWDHLVWSTFGHYDVHSTELETQQTGKTKTGWEKEWKYASGDS